MRELLISFEKTATPRTDDIIFAEKSRKRKRGGSRGNRDLLAQHPVRNSSPLEVASAVPPVRKRAYQDLDDYY